MNDLISRQAVLALPRNKVRSLRTYEVIEETISVTDIEHLPSAQADLIADIQNGIKATNTDDVYSCGMRNGMRWCISLIDNKKPLYENCPSAQPEIIRRTDD